MLSCILILLPSPSIALFSLAPKATSKGAPPAAVKPSENPLCLRKSFASLLGPSSPPSLADLVLTNKGSGNEYRLHTPILALRGIGSHPRIELEWHLPTSKPVITPSMPKFVYENPSLAQHTFKEDERLRSFKTLLEDSNVSPIYIDLAISDLYNLKELSPSDSGHVNSTEDDAAHDNLSSFSVPSCLETLRFILHLERLNIGTQSCVAQFADEFAKKAKLDEVADILNRLFSASPFGLSDKTTVETSPSELYNMQASKTFQALVHTLLPLPREFAEDFKKLLTTFELSERSLLLDGVAPLLGLVLFPDPPRPVNLTIVLPTARVTGLVWQATDHVDYKPVTEYPSNGSANDGPVRLEVDMVSTGKKLLAKIDALPSDFAVGIQGSGSRFLIAQGWLMMTHWSYFKRLATEGKFEISDRVFVLPSNFPIDILEVVLMLVHDSSPSQVQKNIDHLYESDNNFLFVRGSRYGIIDNLLDEPCPNDVFEPLQRHIMTYEEKDDEDDDEELNAPVFAFNGAKASNASPSGGLSGIFGSSQPANVRKDQNSVMVSNLAAGSTEELLQHHFGSFGEIMSVEWSRAVFGMQFAIIEYPSVEAKKAALSLSGTDIEGRMIVVSEVNVFGFSP